MNNSLLNWRTIIFMLTLLGLIGCSQKAVQQQTTGPAESVDLITSVDESKEDRVIDADEYQAGIDALSLKDYSAAKKIFSRFTEKNPKLSGAYLNLAFIAYRQEDYDEADRLSSRALELNPQHPQAYHLRALLHQHKGDIRLAEKDYRKAIQLNPRYTIAHYNLALLYDIFLQELEPAIEHYSIYLKLLDGEDENTQNWINHLKNALTNG